MKFFTELRDADKNNNGGIYDVANTRFSIGELYVSMNDWPAALRTFESAKVEFEAALAGNPADSYTRRMSTLNLHRIGLCYTKLPPSAGNAKTAVTHLNAALESLNRMNADGVLGSGDLPLLKEIPALIAKVDS